MKTVLIMEDNVSLALDWQDALERNGYKVQLTYSGEEAIEALNNSLYDIVITDLFTNTEKGGLSLIGKLCAMGRKAPPVIAVTGAPDPGGGELQSSFFLQQAARLGAQQTLLKPFPAAELVLAADALTGWG